MRGMARALAERLGGLMVMAEDQPRADNRVELHGRATDEVGVRVGRVTHRHSARDRAARAVLAAAAAGILREAGALATHVVPIKTFSHAVGTVRMGVDPTTSVLDEQGRFRGLVNLSVIDGSFMPTAAGVNPSLTIAANALRCAEALSGRRLDGLGSHRLRLPVMRWPEAEERLPRVPVLAVAGGTHG
jgi:choline dehydrogenase-like flavoprotein